MYNILFYCYGNHQMGMGHVYKMSALAHNLKAYNSQIKFLMPDYEEGINYIAGEGHDIYKIDSRLSEDLQIGSAGEFLERYSPYFIIVDSLQSSIFRSSFFKKYSKYLVVFDDTGTGHKYADLVFNTIYKCLYPDGATYELYESPLYTLLREDFGLYNQKEKVIPKRVQSILVTQGGADTYGVLPELTKILSAIDNDITIDVVIGPSFKHWNELKDALSAAPRSFNIKEKVRDMARLMYNTDLAISGAGVTLYELAAIGVPTIVVTQEYKEIETADLFQSYGFIISYGLWETVNKENLLDNIKLLIDDQPKRLCMSQQGKRSVDGQGMKRITNILKEYLQ
ncbi:glycosyltransferase spore coat polysaccharide biosynthesis protein SpsG [Candidatus Magnetobacterium bavaricum]|uniref:Glycosyltransferase spore coat polysaccharide biosynthesis protein SpsG n=1 Tax=Candidatus Magnetobacterium bavaricum TaxID=29290 RepID=A0A0F3GJR0_9BACT|nr:glycosyltransferase spore coat polysaccharide biosynthesis protein SpsG [Candidatus Magnetobacterium bavaricum]